MGRRSRWGVRCGIVLVGAVIGGVTAWGAVETTCAPPVAIAGCDDRGCAVPLEVEAKATGEAATR